MIASVSHFIVVDPNKTLKRIGGVGESPSQCYSLTDNDCFNHDEVNIVDEDRLFIYSNGWDARVIKRFTDEVLQLKRIEKCFKNKLQ